jgi:hypothetical protein
MQQTNRRSSSAIRNDFKILTVQRAPGTSGRAHFEQLWDEVNRAATAVMESQAMGDYVALLKEMDEWYQAEKRRGAFKSDAIGDEARA